jgi:hypothetical protein
MAVFNFSVGSNPTGPTKHRRCLLYGFNALTAGISQSTISSISHADIAATADNYLDYLRLKMRRIVGEKPLPADVQKNTIFR